MWFDPRAALAEIEAATPANSANSANPHSGEAGQFAGFAGFATPPDAAAEIPLDPEGLPFTPCPGCGDGNFWKPADLPPEGAGWRCTTCTPPPAALLRHACALPLGGTFGTDAARPLKAGEKK